MFWYRDIAEFPISETTISETTTFNTEVYRTHGGESLNVCVCVWVRGRDRNERLDNGAVTAALFLADVAAHGSLAVSAAPRIALSVFAEFLPPFPAPLAALTADGVTSVPFCSSSSTPSHPVRFL